MSGTDDFSDAEDASLLLLIGFYTDRDPAQSPLSMWQ